MGSLFGSSKPRKSEYELEQERRLIEEQKAADEEKAKLVAAEEKRKKRIAKGLIGSRSLFARAGGRGFYDESGKEIS
jgi:hypothetical protein